MPLQQAVRDERDMVMRARRRDEDAIRVIIQRNNRRLYRIARGILGDDAEAEDAVQETYLKAFLHLDEFRGEAAIGTWLCRIVMNEALDRLRRRRPTVDWTIMEDNGKLRRGNHQSCRLVRGRTRSAPQRSIKFSALLEQAIDELPDEFRLVLVARAVEEMSVEETASLLDIRPETVKTRLHRARQRLRASLEAKVGPVLKDVFPFEDPRCARIADNVVRRLNLVSSREPFLSGPI